MSKIALEPNVAGTGTFSIASPNSNTNRTLTLPDETGTVLTSVSAIPAAQITGALNAAGSAPIYACRAWVNFNGTGTVAIRASGNVSSITDLGTGTYQVNLATAMSDTNYAKIATASTNSGFVPQAILVDYSRQINNYSAPATTYFVVSVMEMSGAYNAIDGLYINCAVFR